MSGNERRGRADWIGGLALLAVLAAAAGTLAGSASETSRPGFALVPAGVAGVLLLGFPLREIASALGAAARVTIGPGERRRAALVWEAAARNAWLLTGASAVAGFVSVLSSDTGTPSRFVSGLGDHAAGAALGLLLAVLFAVPAIRLLPAPALSSPAEAAPSSPSPWQRVVGGVVLLAVLAWPLLVGGRSDELQPRSWLLSAPAWLLTVGTTLALALYLRAIGRGASVVVAVGGAGSVGVLLGLARGFHGFATGSIGAVAGGLVFAISSAYAALAGLGAVGLPLLDADAREGRPPSAAARWLAYAFPLLVVALLAAAALLVTVPMEPAGSR